jgi:hypothetical protein
MTSAISLKELLAWSLESSGSWKARFNADPALLELPCGIDGAPTAESELVYPKPLQSS